MWTQQWRYFLIIVLKKLISEERRNWILCASRNEKIYFILDGRSNTFNGRHQNDSCNKTKPKLRRVVLGRIVNHQMWSDMWMVVYFIILWGLQFTCRNIIVCSTRFFLEESFYSINLESFWHPKKNKNELRDDHGLRRNSLKETKMTHDYIWTNDSQRISPERIINIFIGWLTKLLIDFLILS